MKTFLNSWVLVGAFQLMGAAVFAQSADLIEYKNAVLAEHAINDGDSFFVQVDGKTMHLRLYFADSPEAEVYSDHDARRVQEQARYFGIDQPDRILWLGEQSAAFTREVLSKPFTVYTAHAAALGGASSERIYAFVVTSNGRDLSELLIENGFARNFGVKRERYDKMPQSEVEYRLRDMEIAAMLSTRGIWSESNPNRIVESRAQQRAESTNIQQIMTSTIRLVESPLNINTATQRELERIPGIGPVTASRIIQNRPFANLEQLKTVPGIGAKTYKSILPFIRIAENSATNG